MKPHLPNTFILKKKKKPNQIIMTIPPCGTGVWSRFYRWLKCECSLSDTHEASQRFPTAQPPTDISLHDSSPRFGCTNHPCKVPFKLGKRPTACSDMREFLHYQFHPPKHVRSLVLEKPSHVPEGHLSSKISSSKKSLCSMRKASPDLQELLPKDRWSPPAESNTLL